MVIVVILILSIVTTKTYAEDSNTFGVRLIPNKMVENSYGILEISALYDSHVFPIKIQDLAFSSTDSTIVQVVGIEGNQSGFITHVKIKANNPGTADIVLAAPGFASEQFPITVYQDKISPSSLIVKATPAIFSINGPKTGYFSVELANIDGLPVPAKNNIPITLATTDGKILGLDTPQLTIKNGTYYAIGQFSTGQPGSARIFASSPSLEPSNATVTVTSSDTPVIQAYVYPSKINDFQTSTAYVVAQLKDSMGNEMIANEDIPISIMITNSTKTGLVNTSPQDQLISSNSPLIIKKGDYEGFAPIQVEAGLNGTFNIGLSAPEGYSVSNHTAGPTDCSEIAGCSEPSSTTLSSTPVQLTTVTSQMLDDKSAKLDVLPILATGNKELVGIMHLEDPYGTPVIASKDLQIEVDSSDPNYLSIDPVHINQGQADAPVFGKVAATAPPPSATSASLPSLLSLHVITYKDTTVLAAINASSVNSFKLSAEPIIPKILSLSDFPLALYLTDSSNSMTAFPSDYLPTILPNDYFHIESKKIASGDGVELLDARSLEDGSAVTNIIVGNYPTSVSLKSVSSLPANVTMDYPSPLYANFSNFVGIQVLDSNSNPRYLDKDASIKLISSNGSVLQLPPTITISKDSYYSAFSVNPTAPGTTTISVVANNLPLSTYQIRVEKLVPEITINSSTTVMPSETFLATLTADRYGKPLPDMSVDWKVSGATIQSSDKTTNKYGTATVALMPKSYGVVSINSTVSGLGFNPVTLKDIVQINSTQGGNGTNATKFASAAPAGIKSFRINGIDPLPIVVAGSIGVGGFLMKKKSIKLFKKNSTGAIKN